MRKTNLLAILALTATIANGQSVSTPVVGFVSTSIKGYGSTGSSSYFSFIPVNLHKTPVFSGTATVTGTTVNLSGASLSAGALNSGSYPTYYLRIQTGSGAGIISDIVSNTVGSVVTSDDLSSYLSSATQVSIIPHTLLTEVLGTESSVILSGGSANTADLVYLVGADGAFKSYYYKTGLGAGWKDSGTGNSVSGLVVYPSESVLVERKQASDTESSATITGQVAANQMVVNFPSGKFSSAANPFPVSMTLSSLTPVVAGGNANTADQVFTVNPSTGQLTAAYYKTGLGAGWKDAGTGIAASTSTDISSGFIVQRRASSIATLITNSPVPVTP
jgi:hypothetical protein